MVGWMGGGGVGGDGCCCCCRVSWECVCLGEAGGGVSVGERGAVRRRRRQRQRRRREALCAVWLRRLPPRLASKPTRRPRGARARVWLGTVRAVGPRSGRVRSRGGSGARPGEGRPFGKTNGERQALCFCHGPLGRPGRGARQGLAWPPAREAHAAAQTWVCAWRRAKSARARARAARTGADCGGLSDASPLSLSRPFSPPRPRFAAARPVLYKLLLT